MTLLRADELRPHVHQVRLGGEWAAVVSVIRAEAKDHAVRLQLEAPFQEGVGCGDPGSGHVDVGPHDVLLITNDSPSAGRWSCELTGSQPTRSWAYETDTPSTGADCGCVMR